VKVNSYVATTGLNLVLLGILSRLSGGQQAWREVHTKEASSACVCSDGTCGYYYTEVGVCVNQRSKTWVA
jgi:hypothetical protein